MIPLKLPFHSSPLHGTLFPSQWIFPPHSTQSLLISSFALPLCLCFIIVQSIFPNLILLFLISQPSPSLKLINNLYWAPTWSCEGYCTKKKYKMRQGAIIHAYNIMRTARHMSPVPAGCSRQWALQEFVGWKTTGSFSRNWDRSLENKIQWL